MPDAAQQRRKPLAAEDVDPRVAADQDRSPKRHDDQNQEQRFPSRVGSDRKLK